MPIERAQMRLRITASKEGRKLKEKLAKICTNMEKEEWDGGTLILVSEHIVYPHHHAHHSVPFFTLVVMCYGNFMMISADGKRLFRYLYTL